MTEPTVLHGEEASTAVSAPYWTALRAGRLEFQQCGSCGRAQHYPRLLCRFCGSTELGWITATGRGAVFAQVVVHRSSAAHLRDLLPYQLAIVRTDEGPLVMALVRGPQVSAGQRVALDIGSTLEHGLLVVVEEPGKEGQ